MSNLSTYGMPLQQQQYNRRDAKGRWEKGIREHYNLEDAPQDKLDWMVEYAQYHHQTFQRLKMMNERRMNENIAYGNMANVDGMGAVLSPIPSATPGSQAPGFQRGVNGVGSGDIGHNLLPLALKVAAQTIGMDLVAVKPSPGPVFELFFLDFRYEDSQKDNDENPQLFKFAVHDDLRSYLENASAYSYRNLGKEQTTYLPVAFVAPPTNATWHDINGATITAGTVGVPEAGIAAGADWTVSTQELINAPNEESSRYGGVISNLPTNGVLTDNQYFTHLQFIEFSRIDGKAIFRAWRQNNTASSGAWQFQQNLNTFSNSIYVNRTLGAFIDTVGAGTMDTATTWAAYFLEGSDPEIAPNPANPFQAPAGNPSYLPLHQVPLAAPFDELPITNDTNPGSSFVEVPTEPPSTFEDHLMGFVTNWRVSEPFNREEDENFYPSVIGPDMSSKRIQTGVVEVAAAVKRNEIEDIKSQFGIDIVEKLQSVLVNELSQTISRQIVNEIYQLGDENRLSVPGRRSASDPAIYNPVPAPITRCNFIKDNTLTPYDYYVEEYTVVNGAGAPGTFENHHSLQRKLISKIMAASNYIYVEGRIGPATFIVTNLTVASILFDTKEYQTKGFDSSINNYGQLYPMGTVLNMTVYVNPYQKVNDNRIVIGRKNAPDHPGLVFVPYLMAQSIALISEGTRAPKLFLRSRYAITKVGFFPQKQYMTIYLCDPQNRLL